MASETAEEGRAHEAVGEQRAPEAAEPAGSSTREGPAEREGTAPTESTQEGAAPTGPTEGEVAKPEAPSETVEAALTEAPPEPEHPALGEAALDTLFRSARTHNAWRDEPISDATLRELFELLRWGPTSANCSPARFLFLRTQEAKNRLRPALSAGNVEKTMRAPATVIIAYDPKFFDLLPRLFPHETAARSYFAGNAAFAEETAFRNGTLQGAYLIVAARALGLDCGPMSGFDRAKVDEEFFAYRGWKSNFLCNLGYGDPTGLYPRAPRLDFDEACELL